MKPIAIENILNFMQTCTTKIDSPATEEEYLLPYRDCVRDDTYRQNVMGSIASQFVTPVLSSGVQAAAIGYAGYSIGKGLGKSGPTVNQNGGGAQSNAQSDAANSVNSGNKTVNIKPHTDINSHNKIMVK